VTEGSGWDLVLLQESMPDSGYGLDPEPRPGKLDRLIHRSDSALVVVMRPAELARIIGYRPDFEIINQSLLKSGGFTQLGARVGCAYIPQQLDSVITENVMGWIEGSKGREEVVVFTAHYDHVGTDEKGIHHGADDNASGTAALIEIARVLQCRKDAGEPFGRSVLLLAVSAEELGLLGSRYFVNSALFDSIQPLVNQNMDMIGRSIQYGMIRSMILREGDGITEDESKRESYVFLMNKKRGTRAYVRHAKRVARDYPGFRIDRSPGMLERLTFRHGSDHANFLKKHVPVLVWFTGLHPDYHTPRDIAGKIDYQNLTTITRVIVSTTERIINR
jgi:Zn-dependent M28 family amino/carboxypeptidase